jgi:hypothetical protein
MKERIRNESLKTKRTGLFLDGLFISFELRLSENRSVLSHIYR